MICRPVDPSDYIAFACILLVASVDDIPGGNNKVGTRTLLGACSREEAYIYNSVLVCHPWESKLGG